MRPIQDLLNRIRWDADFGAAKFELGYWDRVLEELVVIPLGDAEYDHPEDEGFRLIGEDGNPINIPFHRVRKVWRNQELIWSRDP